MLSFVVIGYNEGPTLATCFRSIFKAISASGISAYEIIYVDSGSTDNSIAVALSFAEIRIFSITGGRNAAIARNVGAYEAKGEVLYFIDGDMEIDNRFLSVVIEKDGTLRYDVLSGLVTDVEADPCAGSQKLRKERLFPNTGVLDGGIFLIRKAIWEQMGGMRAKLMNGEDGDLGLRLAKKGFAFIRLQQPIALHYTVNYFERRRLWPMLLNTSAFHCRCVLYRDHLFNNQIYRRIWHDDKSFLVLLPVLASVFIIPNTYFLFAVSAYTLLVVLRSARRERYIPVPEMTAYFILSDLLNLVYFFTLFPKAPSYSYRKVTSAC